MLLRTRGARLVVRFGDDAEPAQGRRWTEVRRQILVVCYGNECRSPVAAGLLRGRLPEDTWQVLSAGTDAVLGRPATKTASAVASELGVELSMHRSQPMDAELVQASGLILTMSRRQANAVIDLDAAAAARTRLLGAFAPSDNLWGLAADPSGPPAEPDEIPDPTGQSRELHRDYFDRVRLAVDEVVAWLKRGARPKEGPPTADRWSPPESPPADELHEL